MVLAPRADRITAMRSAAALFLAECGVGARSQETVLSALVEAVGNAIRHSGSARPIEVEIEANPSDVTVAVTDHGRGCDVAALLPLTKAELFAESGRGLYLIASLCELVELRSQGGTRIAFRSSYVGNGYGPPQRIHKPLLRRVCLL